MLGPSMGPLIRRRSWTKYLPDGFTVQVYLNTLLGQIVSFSVVLIKDDQCITRYDTMHGYAHRDVCGRSSNTPLLKHRYDTLTLKEVFRYADEDLTKNYAKYYAYYEAH
jgi:hypothetical protein